MKRIRLGVNIDHVATLRQVRRARYPDIIEALHLCERGGADQITIHLREDRRHIQDEDVARLLSVSLLPINLEMAMTSEMQKIALSSLPYSITLVPERREEMTTESGLDLAKFQKLVSRANHRASWAKLQKKTRTYAFIDPDPKQVKMAEDLGFDGVEFHTGQYAEDFERCLRGRQALFEKEFQRLYAACDFASSLDLEVKAGHGLTIQNVRPLLDIPSLEELNIGHSIVARSILMGLENAVREMRFILDERNP